MILEREVSAIVMLTCLEENHFYWSDKINESKNYEEIQITLRYKKEHKNYFIREFELVCY